MRIAPPAPGPAPDLDPGSRERAAAHLWDMTDTTRFAIRGTYKGDVVFVRCEVDDKQRLRISLLANPEPRDLFSNREQAERWADKVAKADPSLKVQVVNA